MATTLIRYAPLPQRNWFKERYYRIRHRKQYKAMMFAIALRNEQVTMATEIQQHGRILLKGISVV